MLLDDNNLCKVIACYTWLQSLQRVGAAPVAAGTGSVSILVGTKSQKYA